MSMDLQETIKAIRGMIPIIDPEDDYLTIAVAEEQMEITEAARKRELDDAHAQLRALSRILDSARVSSTRPPTIPSAEQHAAMLNEHDATRLQMAKAINDEEGALASKEAELVRIEKEIRTLEESDPASEHELDGTTLRLAMYKGLGFAPIMKDDHLVKMLIRAESGDVHYVNIDKPNHDGAQLMWKLAFS